MYTVWFYDNLRAALWENQPHLSHDPKLFAQGEILFTQSRLWMCKSTPTNILKKNSGFKKLL